MFFPLLSNLDTEEENFSASEACVRLCFVLFSGSKQVICLQVESKTLATGGRGISGSPVALRPWPESKCGNLPLPHPHLSYLLVKNNWGTRRYREQIGGCQESRMGGEVGKTGEGSQRHKLAVIK